MKKNFWRGMTSVFAVLLCIALTLSSVAFEFSGLVDDFLGIKSEAVEETGIGDGPLYYTSDYGDLHNFTAENLDALLADEEAYIARQLEEGAVLLLNDGALPLAEAERNVTLFGRAVADPVYKGFSNGGDVDPERLVDFKTAMENAGFTVNGTLYDAYSNSKTKRDRKASDIGEEDISFYTSDLKSTFASYNDAAIVMLSRYAGEASDLAVVDADGVPQLSLHQQERDLLKMIYESGDFSKIIVLLNSAYPMELDELEGLHVNACLWIGNPGLTGFVGVANILTGEANPSGRLVDTFASNSLSAPAMVNFGDFRWTNAEAVAAASADNFNNAMGGAMNETYVVYAEGIYVGYKYYETRYEDCILQQGNAASAAGTYASADGAWNYASEVTYPFGYGLSYTTFEQTLGHVTENKDSFEVTVTVTNTGSVAGKDVVQVYAQKPYTDYARENLMEVPSVQLVGFAKTSELAPGAQEDVTVTVDKYLLASYDANGAKTYIMDSGNYYLAIGSNAHDALNNILAAKGAVGMYDHNGQPTDGRAESAYLWTVENQDLETYRYSQQTGAEITNLFGDCDANYWSEDCVTYLSRQDWEGTYPVPVVMTATDEMITLLNGYTYEKPADAPSASEITVGEDHGLTVLDMIGVEYDDPQWDDFLDQLTLEDMAVAVDDQLSTGPVATVNKPKSVNTDGPNGIYGSYNLTKKTATGYANQVVLAATWNTDMMHAYGNFLAEDCLATGTTQLWAPGGNLHRSPYGGRNFEYYSEDAVYAYLCAIPQVQAMVAKGVHVAPKHFVGNDQETNRTGVATFATEQAWREGPMRAFESMFTKGGATGTMTSYSRMGCVFAGASAPLLVDLLRGEWGFLGTTITDNAMYGYIHSVESLVNGTDIFCFNKRGAQIIEQINATDDGYLLSCLREANHRYYYASVNSGMMNGLTDEVKTEEKAVTEVSWWQTAIRIGDCALIVILAICTGLYVVSAVLSEKKRRIAAKKKPSDDEASDAQRGDGI